MYNCKFSNKKTLGFYRFVPDFLISNRAKYATITILPEIVLSHPVYGFDSNSLSKFRRNESMKCKLLKYESESLAWPSFVYDHYDVRRVTEKVKKFLTTLKIGTIKVNILYDQ